MPMLRNIEAERIRNGFTKDKLANMSTLRKKEKDSEVKK